MFAEVSGLDRDDVESLVTECREKLDLVDADLMRFGDGRVDVSKDVINRVFRVFHSVKGAAGYLQHEPLKELSHVTESVLDRVREGSLQLTSAHVDVLLLAADRMRQMVEGDELRDDVDFSKERQALEEILRCCDNACGDTPVDLPLQAVAKADAHSPAATVASPVAPGLKVLIVEDDFTSRLTLQCLLQTYGECHVAVNGREAIQAYSAARQSGKGYDLICMDINMPEMDGRTALKWIRDIEANEGIFAGGVRVFMTTTSMDMKTIVASFQAICDAYITKPIDGKKLEEQLRCFDLIPKRK